MSQYPQQPQGYPQQGYAPQQPGYPAPGYAYPAQNPTGKTAMGIFTLQTRLFKWILPLIYLFLVAWVVFIAVQMFRFAGGDAWIIVSGIAWLLFGPLVMRIPVELAYLAMCALEKYLGAESPATPGATLNYAPQQPQYQQPYPAQNA